MQSCEERQQMLERAAVRKKLCGREWLRSEKPRNYQFDTSREVGVVDLFCGCGGLTFGVLEALYYNRMAASIKLAIDHNPHALEVYKSNFRLSDDVVYKADIGQLLSGNLGACAQSSEIDLIEPLGEVDILVAGPPCQGNSNLNNWTRGDDPRNQLYLKVVRFVELVKPRVVIIENVATVIHDKSQVIDKSQLILTKLGYTVAQFFVKASKIGIPQTRKRHILLAVKGLKFSPDTLTNLFESSTEPPLSDFIDDLLDECKNKDGIFYTPSQMSTDNIKRVNYLFDKDLYDLPDSERPECHRNKKHKYRAVYGRLHWDKPAPTITGGFGSMGQGRFVHPLRRRVITAHEAARIQGFPDFFDFTSVPTRNALYEMIGNAVPPKISALIVDFLFQHGAFKEDGFDAVE
jgi:DNA (cytosine-5)-methyltransferase 1